MTRTFTMLALVLALVGGSIAVAQETGVTFERLLNAAAEPHNWLTYSGTYNSQRHTALDQITIDNATELELKWVFQAQSLQAFEATPIVVDGIMYLTEAPNTVVALDAKLGRVFWRYQYNPREASRPCCGRLNRGLGILGNTLFMATIDARLIAIDATTGQPTWVTDVADPAEGYALTVAPLVIKDKVIVGVAGGEYGIRGFIAAYDAATGEEAWRFYTIPGPGEPGHETWEGDGDAWMHGGASVWLTGSYDPDLNLTYWGIGNPGPDWNPEQRPGRQPVLRFRGRAQRRHGRARLVLPVHAERRLRLRRGADPCAGRLSRARRQHPEADAFGGIGTASSTCSTARAGSSSPATRSCS